MALVRDRCLCLRKVEYSETSQILTLFGRASGLVQVIARGAHRRTKAGASAFDGGIDLLDSGHAVFTHAPGRDLGSLTEWKLIDGQRALRRSLRGIHLGLCAAEIVSLLLEAHDPHPRVHERLEGTLGALGDATAEAAFAALVLDVLEEAGFAPQVGACVGCSRSLPSSGPVGFSFARGGVLCRRCAGTARLPRWDVRMFRAIEGLRALPREGGRVAGLPALTPAQGDALNRLLLPHVEHVLQRALRLRRLVVPERRRASAGSTPASAPPAPAP